MAMLSRIAGFSSPFLLDRYTSFFFWPKGYLQYDSGCGFSNRCPTFFFFYHPSGKAFPTLCSAGRGNLSEYFRRSTYSFLISLQLLSPERLPPFPFFFFSLQRARPGRSEGSAQTHAFSARPHLESSALSLCSALDSRRATFPL